jgi:cytochrome c-type biogenesis protein CcmF
MFPVIGFGLLLLVLAISIFLSVFNSLLLSKADEKKLLELEKISLILSAITFLAALLSQFCLIGSFLLSDYSVANVYQNSHHLKPFIYKISGSWGNHEGSMLLLIAIISGYNFAFAFLSKIDAKRKLIISSSQSIITALFAAFSVFTSNPFTRIFPAPKAGLGLNPLLQDLGLALHPPLLYIGYVGFSLTFSFAMAGLLTAKIDHKFALYLKNWLFFSYGFLTLGIGLGGWWAYRELGWGGYWFWDPVENISLMPWIAATALLHCLRLLEKKEILKIWTAFLAIMTFILCLFGTFLVRSGVLTSVHSFAIDAGRGFFIIGIILLIGGGGLLIFGVRMTKLGSKRLKIAFYSRAGAILFNNYFLIIALFVMLLGTIYPILSRGIFDQFISIGPNYYNQIFSILIIPFLLFLAISNHLPDLKKPVSKKSLGKKSLGKKPAGKNKNILNLSFLNLSLDFSLYFSIIISAFGTFFVFFYYKNAGFLQIIILFLAILSAFLTARPLFKLILNSVVSHDFSLVKNKKPNNFPQNAAMFLGHLGFCLIIIGIVLTSSFGAVKEVNMQKNNLLKLAGYEIKFTGVEYFAGKNFLARQGNFTVFENNKKIGKLTPQLRYYPVSEQTTNEASIKHGIFNDLYLVIGNKDDNENYAVRAYYKPFIYLIWLGCAMIFSAAILIIINSAGFKFRFKFRPVLSNL